MNRVHLTCIISQCFGQLAIFAFDNGFMFNYFTHLGCDDFTIIFLLKMINILGMFIIIPLAYIAERSGKKKIGQRGNWIQVFGLLILWSASFFSEVQMILLYSGALIFALGTSMFRSTWFALLAPLLQKDERVTFFASLRTSWKLCSLAFGFMIQFILSYYGVSASVQIVLGLSFLTLLQIIFYQKIPDIPDERDDCVLPGFLESIKEMKHHKEFLCILKFKFCVPLFTGCIALIFNLYEKNILGYSADQIMLMGNSLFIGGLIGFWSGAWLIKKFDEILVFRFSSLMLVAISLLFSSIPFIPWPVVIHTSLTTFLFGLCMAMIGMAETNIMLDLLPKGKNIIASSIWITITQIGFTISSLISAFMVKYLIIDHVKIHSFVNSYSLLLWCFLFPLPFFAFKYTKQLEQLKKIN